MSKEILTFSSEDYTPKPKQEAPKPDEAGGSCWDYENKKIETPPRLNIIEADSSMAETIEQFERDVKVEMYFHPDNQNDYAMWGRDDMGNPTVRRVSEVVTINGVQTYLYPGKNMVPKTVHEFLMTVEDLRRKISAGPPPPRMVAEL